MLVRTSQGGDFMEDEKDEGRSFDVVAEMYEIELQNATASMQETQVYKEEREA